MKVTFCQDGPGNHAITLELDVVPRVGEFVLLTVGTSQRGLRVSGYVGTGEHEFKVVHVIHSIVALGVDVIGPNMGKPDSVDSDISVVVEPCKVPTDSFEEYC